MKEVIVEWVCCTLEIRTCCPGQGVSGGGGGGAGGGGTGQEDEDGGGGGPLVPISPDEEWLGQRIRTIGGEDDLPSTAELQQLITEMRDRGLSTQALALTRALPELGRLNEIETRASVFHLQAQNFELLGNDSDARRAGIMAQLENRSLQQHIERLAAQAANAVGQ